MTYLKTGRAEERAATRRQFLLHALSTGALLGGPGWNPAAWAGWFGGMPGKMPEGRSIFDMRGEVLVNGKRADYNTRISASDRVTTGEGSYVVTAVGQTAFILRERSVLEMSGKEFFVGGMRLISGALLGVFGKRKPEDQLEMRTPVATIGIRGTGIYAESEPEKSYICTCYGTTDIASAMNPDDKTSVTTLHHDAAKYVLKDAEAGQRIVPAPFINHTDLELMTIEALVGRKVPFGLQNEIYETPRREY